MSRRQGVREDRDRPRTNFSRAASGRWIVAEHLESGASDPDEAITRVIAVLDTEELADAINRLEHTQGLRVVK